MKELTEKDLAWKSGFEAGVAFTLRRFTENGTDISEICKLVGDLQALRAWKTADEWEDFVVRNCVTDGRYF